MALTKKQKDYIFYSVLSLLAIGISIALIAQHRSKQEGEMMEVSSLNMEMPDPTTMALPEEKEDAYAQREMELLAAQDMAKKEGLYDVKLNSSSGNSSDLYSSSDRRAKNEDRLLREFNQAVSQPPVIYTQEKSSSSIESRTDEIESLKREIEDLKTQKSDRHQAELLDMMYALTGTGENANSKSEESPKQSNNHPSMEIKALPKASAIVNASGVRRNNFHSLGSTAAQKNTIKAVVYGTQKIMNGQQLKLRLSESMQIGSNIIKAGAILVGTATIGVDRLLVSITSIEYGEVIYYVQLEVYDTDGQHLL